MIMKKFEYQHLHLPSYMNPIEWLNELGSKGWELVNVSASDIAYLKREIPNILNKLQNDK